MFIKSTKFGRAVLCGTSKHMAGWPVTYPGVINEGLTPKKNSTGYGVMA